MAVSPLLNSASSPAAIDGKQPPTTHMEGPPDVRYLRIKEGSMPPFELKSKAFANGGEIPSRYTCTGEDVSPALTWSGVPPAAKTLALIAEDPDAPHGTFTHWVIWNLPARHKEIEEGISGRESFEDGARQGRNDFGRIGYRGPCPPHGRPHRYFFHLYALDTVLDLEAGADRQELQSAMQGHVLGQAQWMGTYRR